MGKKLDPNIIRVNDTVKIINPELFIRCGYQLNQNILKEQISDNLINKIRNLTYELNKTFIEEHKIRSSGIINLLTIKQHDDIINFFIKNWLSFMEYGGNNRELFTHTDLYYQDKIAIVQNIKTVVTGKYIPGSKNAFIEEVEAAILKDQKRHRILYIKFEEDSFVHQIAIESKNVEKLHL